LPLSRIDLGVKTDIEAVTGLVDVRGLRLIDVGCGPGRTSRELVAAGARVFALEPDPVQAAENGKLAPIEGLEFAQARAESLPVADAAFDGALFFRSLHHVPINSMERAIGEAARALKPGGFVCFVEPGMEGTHFPLMRPFHDETVVRNAAQAALDRYAAPLFKERSRYVYRQFPKYADFAAFVARVMGQTFNDIQREKVETEEVRRRFEAGRQANGEYQFDQPMLLDLFRAPAKG
jgi:SAM-dependent methyltransferase